MNLQSSSNRPVQFWHLIVLLSAFIIGLPIFMTYHAASMATTNVSKNVLPLSVPPRGHRLLVIAPHPDDESLGTGGLMAQALAQGNQVRVVFMTNGDGFRYGVQKMEHVSRVGASDFLHYGETRQQEALTATGILGLKPDSVIFLGFPDQGLAPLWNNYWDQSQPYTSRQTGVTAVPYKLAYLPGQKYTAPVLLNTLKKILTEYQPDDIYFTDTYDFHPDHWATGAFILAAIAELEERDPSFKPNIYTYVIHRYENNMIPVEQGKTHSVLPPSYFLDLGDKWYEYRPGDKYLALKREAIGSYKSQVLIMPGFFSTFERPHEVFCLHTFKPVFTSPLASAKAAGQFIWPGISRIAFNPSGDLSKQKGKYSSALKAGYILQDGQTIRLRFDTLGVWGVHATYKISVYLLPTNPEAIPRRFTMQIVPDSKQITWLARPSDYDLSAASINCQNDIINIVLPDAISDRQKYLMINADTFMGPKVLDRIPWYLMRINESNNEQ